MMALDVTSIKVIVVVIMLLVVLAVCVAPIYILMRLRSSDEAEEFAVRNHAANRRKKRKRAKWISRLSVFAAGVFVSIGLMDLFPDANSDLDKAVKVYKWSMPEFPFSYFLMLCGFFLVLVLEQVALFFKERSVLKQRFLQEKMAREQPDENTPLMGDRSHLTVNALPVHMSHGSRQESYTASYIQTHAIDVTGRADSTRAIMSRSFTNSSLRRAHSWSNINEIPDSYYDTLTVPSIVGIRNQPVFSQTPDSQENLLDIDAVENELANDSIQSSPHHCEHQQEGGGHNDGVVSSSNMRTVLLVLAMTVHSLFEGISLGLMFKLEDAVSFFVAILMHKTIVAFSIGMQLGGSSLKVVTIVCCVLIFSFMSPIGAVIGMLVINLVDRNPANLVSGILQSLTSGTFLYVAFFEVLPHEFNNGRDRLGKLVSLILGFTVVTVYVVIDNIKLG